jgi:hypothetical protein
MFRTLYSSSHTVARHEKGLHESRRRFLEHLAAEGASRSMLLRASGVMYRAAVELVVADSKFDDEYTLRHIGECAACVDDITALNADFQWMKENFK